MIAQIIIVQEILFEMPSIPDFTLNIRKFLDMRKSNHHIRLFEISHILRVIQNDSFMIKSIVYYVHAFFLISNFSSSPVLKIA